MRHWQYFWYTVNVAAQQNPPQFVETLMLGLAVLLIVIWTFHVQALPFLVLGWIYTIGASASILVRECFIAPTYKKSTLVATGLTLLCGLFLIVCFVQSS